MWSWEPKANELVRLENKKLLKYGFRFYETITPYQAGESFVSHRVFMGSRDTVDLGILQDTPITIPRGQRKKLEANFQLDEKLQATTRERQSGREIIFAT